MMSIGSIGPGGSCSWPQPTIEKESHEKTEHDEDEIKEIPSPAAQVDEPAPPVQKQHWSELEVALKEGGWLKNGKRDALLTLNQIVLGKLLDLLSDRRDIERLEAFFDLYAMFRDSKKTKDPKKIQKAFSTLDCSENSLATTYEKILSFSPFGDRSINEQSDLNTREKLKVSLSQLKQKLDLFITWSAHMGALYDKYSLERLDNKNKNLAEMASYLKLWEQNPVGFFTTN